MSIQRNPDRVPTVEQWREFEETGLMHLRGAITEEQVHAMRERLWDELRVKHQIRRDDKHAWPEGRVFGLPNPRREGAFAAMQCAPLCAALNAIFAPDGWQRPVRWGSPLVTFPSCGRRWDVVVKGWHLDIGGPQGVQPVSNEVTVFAYLDGVEPEGGGTLAVLGSHRLIQKLAADAKTKVRSENGRHLLALADGWLRDLSSDVKCDSRKRRFMEEGAVVRGIPLKVVEITGEPGDLVVMHSCTLHAASVNCSERPRLVVRESVFRSGAPVTALDEDSHSKRSAYE